MFHQNQISVKTYSIFFPCYPKGITWKTKYIFFEKWYCFETPHKQQRKNHIGLSIILKRNWTESWTNFYKSGWREGKVRMICIPCSCFSWCAFIFSIKEIFAFITNSITKTQKLLWSKWILHHLQLNQQFFTYYPLIVQISIVGNSM